MHHRWDAQYNVPNRIIKALYEYHPRCRLYIRVVPGDDTAVVLPRLRYVSCLHSLIVNFSSEQLQAYVELLLIASNCRNLKGLAIQSVTGFGDQFQNLGLRSEGLRALEIDQVVPHDTRLTDNIDCSALERLSVNSLSFFLFRNATARLKGLRSLRIDRCWSYDWLLEPFKSFLHTCLVLEELDLTGFTAQSDVFLFQHLGKTLKRLRLHEHEDPSGICRRRVLSISEIEDLGRNCPRLRRLGLDVAYDGCWVSLELRNNRWPSKC